MQPLIDADVLLYEIGYAAETGWQQPGFPPFDYVADLFESRVANICAAVGATKPPIYYLTGKGNFRYTIAKRTPYKERDSLKPYHYKNLKAYIKFFKDYEESEGMEAFSFRVVTVKWIEKMILNEKVIFGNNLIIVSHFDATF